MPIAVASTQFQNSELPVDSHVHPALPFDMLADMSSFDVDAQLALDTSFATGVDLNADWDLFTDVSMSDMSIDMTANWLDEGLSSPWVNQNPFISQGAEDLIHPRLNPSVQHNNQRYIPGSQGNQQCMSRTKADLGRMQQHLDRMRGLDEDFWHHCASQDQFLRSDTDRDRHSSSSSQAYNQDSNSPSRTSSGQLFRRSRQTQPLTIQPSILSRPGGNSPASDGSSLDRLTPTTETSQSSSSSPMPSQYSPLECSGGSLLEQPGEDLLVQLMSNHQRSHGNYLQSRPLLGDIDCSRSPSGTSEIPELDFSSILQDFDMLQADTPLLRSPSALSATPVASPDSRTTVFSRAQQQDSLNTVIGVLLPVASDGNDTLQHLASLSGVHAAGEHAIFSLVPIALAIVMLWTMFA